MTTGEHKLHAKQDGKDLVAKTITAEDSTNEQLALNVKKSVADDYQTIVKMPAMYPMRAMSQGIIGHCTV